MPTRRPEPDIVTQQAFTERAAEPFELLETLRLSDGRMIDAPAHLARMAGAAAHFRFAFDVALAREALDALAARHPRGEWRIRLLGDPGGAVRAQAFPLGAAPAGPRVQLAAAPIEGSHGEFFRFKTTRRAHYEAFAPRAATIFDTLLWNEQGELTEFTRGNVALRMDGEWLTPPLACGLLPGVGRASLLQQGRLREALLICSDLARAQGVAFFNSLRGWIEVEVAEAEHPGSDAGPMP